ncbi:hypothetical protein D9613_000706 [Agrocybe pediades]|uniref:DASH complex subunit DUO1 n=1 Tax=Agrocybe pediades TaxID=84607 RepID=A0A8H4VUH4_9AGAR|nr:hypothetical protein D9613_000706 [Agrocybe pediades]
MNSPDINVASGQSILGFESPNISSGTSFSYDVREDDLSLADLSLGDRTAIMSKPFSLLAREEPPEPQPQTPQRDRTRDSSSDGLAGEDDLKEEVVDQLEEEDQRKHAAKLREEKLQSDIFILKKLNASFEMFNQALEDTGSANERVALQLEQTDALLNKYITVLSKSEEYARLIFDDEWLGAEEDEKLLARQLEEQQERQRREAEEARLRAEQEAARLEQERQERLQREEKERLAKEKSEKAIRGGLRGVRGTRGSMRGTVRTDAPSRTDSGIPSRGLRRPAPSAARPSNIARPARST